MDIGLVTLILILANGYFSYNGFKDKSYLRRYSFVVQKITAEKEYLRLISSGFLHVNWLHLIFNMVGLFLFGNSLEISLGMFNFGLIYFVSLVFGNLLALYIHRNHPDYAAVGASGAVSGLVFAAIGMFPNMQLSLLLIPVYFPAWLFGISFVLFSIYGIKSQKDNIGHEAHLGGGIIGLLCAIVLSPEILSTNTLIILLILVPSVLFLGLLILKPNYLILANAPSSSSGFLTVDDKYNLEKVNRQKELDVLLDKINKSGIDALSEKDKIRLGELSGDA